MFDTHKKKDIDYLLKDKQWQYESILTLLESIPQHIEVRTDHNGRYLRYFHMERMWQAGWELYYASNSDPIMHAWKYVRSQGANLTKAVHKFYENLESEMSGWSRNQHKYIEGYIPRINVKELDIYDAWDEYEGQQSKKRQSKFMQQMILNNETNT